MAESRRHYPVRGIGEDHIQFVVKKADHSLEWVIIDRWEERELGQRLPMVVEWSQTGQSLYFASSSIADGCPLFMAKHDLYRVNLIDGTVAEILPPSALAWDVSLSPNEATVAYLTSRELRYIGGFLVLRNLATGAERQFQIQPKDSWAWGIVWSPDGNELAFTLSTDDDPCDPKAFSIIKLDTASLRSMYLGRDDPRLLQTVSWPDPEYILLKDREGKYWRLEIGTGDILPLSVPQP